MNILLINMPSRRGIGGFMLPLGLLYVGAIIERCGHKAKIVDLYLDDVELKDFEQGRLNKKIDEVIEDYEPSIVGYGGIATSYGRTKRLSFHIKNNYPQITQIAGGALSSTYELLLTKTKVDAVFHGETEVSLPIWLERFQQKEPIYDVPGISYMLGEKIVKNDAAGQVENLDTIPFPAYHLVDITRYLDSVKDRLEHFKIHARPYYQDLVKRIGTKRHNIPIIASRGCTHKCSFCYRHVRGIRRYSVNYVIEHIKYLKETYGIGGFQFSDELFNSSYEWVMEFCDAIDKDNLNIFYIVGGARADKIDEQMLRRLRDTGCIMIEYGQESGSDTILKEYRKGISSQQNKEITLLTEKIGIFSCVQLVIGSPSETTKTIYETIQFLKDVEENDYSLNYLIPLPGAPIWQYVKENELIQDVEQYLDLVAEFGGSPLVNLTKESDKVWEGWGGLIHKELKLHYYRRISGKGYYLYKFLFYLASANVLLIPRWIRRLIPGWAKVLLLKWY